jgi:hypothetical protein
MYDGNSATHSKYDLLARSTRCIHKQAAADVDELQIILLHLVSQLAALL